jgi:hypothetical protein
MYAAGTETVLHERIYDLDLTFTPLVGEAPPDADPDPDPDPADPDPDPDPNPDPGDPEEPVPPEPPEAVVPDDGDAPDPDEWPRVAPEWEEGPGLALPVPGLAPANTIFNVRFVPPNGTYETGTRVVFRYDFTKSELGEVYIRPIPMFNGVIASNYRASNRRHDEPVHEGGGSNNFTVNSPQSVNQVAIRMYGPGGVGLLFEVVKDVDYTFE